MALPQSRIGNPQTMQGGNKNPKAPKAKPKPPEKTLNTHTDPQSQIACPTSQKQPQNKHNEEKAEIENVASVNWQSKDEVRNAVTLTTPMSLAETLELHLQTKISREPKREYYQQKCRRKKCRRKGLSLLFKERQPLGIPNTQPHRY